MGARLRRVPQGPILPGTPTVAWIRDAPCDQLVMWLWQCVTSKTSGHYNFYLGSLKMLSLWEMRHSCCSLKMLKESHGGTHMSGSWGSFIHSIPATFFSILWFSLLFVGLDVPFSTSGGVCKKRRWVNQHSVTYSHHRADITRNCQKEKWCKPAYYHLSFFYYPFGMIYVLEHS